MNKKINRCIAFFLSVVLMITSVNITNSLKEVEASDEQVTAFEQEAGEMTVISQEYGDETYNVMTGHLKAVGGVSHDWSNTVVIGVSGTGVWQNYGFQIAYGTSSSENLVKLNNDKGYGTYNGIKIEQEQWYNSGKLEKLFTEDGIDIKAVRLGAWAYLLVDMGDGYELLGTMYVPTSFETQFTLNNNATSVEMSNITIATGKENALVALKDMQMDITTSSMYFPVGSTSWTVEGKLTADIDAVLASTENDDRIALAGTSTWNGTTAVDYTTKWIGQGIPDWTSGNIPDTHSALLSTTGMWVRWTRQGGTVFLWTSADGQTWSPIVSSKNGSVTETGIYISTRNDIYASKLTDMRFSCEFEYPDFTQGTYAMTTFTGSYDAETCNVMEAKLKATGEITYDWSSLFAIGVSGTTKWENYAFQILFGTSQGANRIKLNENKGYGTYDNITIARDQIYDNVKLEKIYSDGINIKVVRLNTWAYFLIDMGDGYELLGTMYVPTAQETQFTLYSNNSGVEMSNIQISNGKENALAALSGMSMKLTSAGQYFPIDSTSWMVEGRLTADMSAVPDTGDNRIAIVGTSTWEGTIAVIRQSGTWKGQGITNWSTGNISSTHTELLASNGMWVRWVREENVLALWISSDGDTWTRIVENAKLSSDAIGAYIKSANDSYGSMMTDMRISSECEYPNLKLSASGSSKITSSYGAQTYNVMTAHIKGTGAITHDWGSYVNVCVSGDVSSGYRYQILYGQKSAENRVKLTKSGTYDVTYDGITIAQSQFINSAKLENLPSTGLDIKVVRLNTWTHLFIDMGDGYELFGTMYIPTDQATQFSIQTCSKFGLEVSNVKVSTGKAAVVAALEGTSMKLTSTGSTGKYFPVDSTIWTVEGRLTTDMSQATTLSDQNRIALLGKGTWDDTIAVMYRTASTAWSGQGIESWTENGISDNCAELLATDGMFVRWVRDGSKLSLWVSTDGKNWSFVVESTDLSEGAGGIYALSENDSYASVLKYMKITLTADYPSDNQNQYNFEDLNDFTCYTSGSDSYSAIGNKLTPSGTNGDLKAILNEKISNVKSVSVDIIPGDSGLINAGIYVDADQVSNTSIDALAFVVTSNYTGWSDAPNRIDLDIKEFPDATILQHLVAEQTNGNAIFSNKVKETLNLRLDFEGDTITATLGLKSNPSKYIQTVYNIDVTTIDGYIGLGNFSSDARFDNLLVTYASRAVTETATYTNEGYNFSSGMTWQSTKSLGTTPNTIEAWVKVPTAIADKTRGIMISNYREIPTFSLEMYTNGNPRLYWRDPDGTTNDIVVSDVDLRTGAWTHIAFVRDAETNTVTFYLNGVATYTKENVSLQDIEPQIFYMGQYNSGTNKNRYWFTGELADVRTWDRALSGAEVQTSMTTEYTSQDNLILNVALNEEVPLWVSEGQYDEYTFSDSSSSDNSIEIYERVFNWTEDTSESGDYSMVVIPDQQILTRYYPDRLDEIYDWIAENTEKENIEMVINLGDITDDNSIAGWQKSLEVYEKIQELVSYIHVPGNHDYDESSYRNTTMLNEYFPLSMFKEMSTYGGSYSDDREVGTDDSSNTWQELKINGHKYLIIGLEFGPRDDVLEWANEVVSAHPDHQVIVVTHGYMNYDGTRLSSGESGTPPTYTWLSNNTDTPNDGEGIWDKFVSKHENIIMVLSGHIGSDNMVTRVDEGENGNKVIQMLLNGQDVDQQYGGIGFLSIFRFSADGTLADVTYFSPYHGENGVDEYLNDNQFTISLPQPVVEESIIKGATVSLEGNIGLNFYMDLNQDILEDDGAYVRFKLPGENYTETKVMVADGKTETISGVQYHVFSCGIAAKEMTSNVVIEVVRGNGEVVDQGTFRVVDYANTILTDQANYTDADRTMVKALLNYGGYAQLHFGYNVTDLANAPLQEQDRAVSMPTLDESVNYTIEGTINGLSYYGTSLMLVTKTSVRHYFELSEGEIEDYTFTCNDKELKPVKKGTRYYVEITDIVASELDKMYSLTITKGTESMTLTYGPYTYIKTIVAGNSYNAETKNIMAALYAYSVAAENYLTNSQQ